MKRLLIALGLFGIMAGGAKAQEFDTSTVTFTVGSYSLVTFIIEMGGLTVTEGGFLPSYTSSPAGEVLVRTNRPTWTLTNVLTPTIPVVPTGSSAGWTWALNAASFTGFAGENYPLSLNVTLTNGTSPHWLGVGSVVGLVTCTISSP